MYTRKQWKEGDIAQYFPQHIYHHPQACTIKKVAASGAVTRIFFHELPIARAGLEDFGINEKYISRDENRFLQEYVPKLTEESEETE